MEYEFLTVDDLKARVPLHLLCAALDIRLDADRSVEYGRSYAPCPFHLDENPSFYLWWGDQTSEWRWSCQVCAIGGDQVDLLERLRGCSFHEALIELEQLSADLPEIAPAPPPPAKRDRVQTARDLSRVVGPALKRAKQQRYRGYMSTVGVPYVTDPALAVVWDDHLRRLGWGVDDHGRVVFPYWLLVQTVGAKIRALDGSRTSVPGSTYPVLYLSWLPREHDAVLVCEGETDAGWASFYGPASSIDVRGLPRGAGAPPRDDLVSDLMEWETIYLGLDADDAGERAKERWLDALKAAGHPDIRIVQLPAGGDIRSAGIPLERLLADAVRS